MNFAFALFIQAITAASSFSVHDRTAITRTFKVSLKFHPATFERAVDCASNYGMCDVDELLNLAKGVSMCTDVVDASRSLLYIRTV
jgi:hypothetical protein